MKIGTDADGGVDVDDLREHASDDVASLMLTNPNTLGVYDRNIEEIARICTTWARRCTTTARTSTRSWACAAGRHGDRHHPLQPAQDVHAAARRRRPGAGPIAVSDRIEPFLPRPSVTSRIADGYFDLDFDRPQSIGRLRGFQGNFGVFVRSYAYILSLGADGLAEASDTAVLNANYLMARLRELCGEHIPAAYDRTCMHEFVLTGGPMKRALGIRTTDLAKRLLDHGFHPPTVYFPLLVDEALLIEPTETETRETLDSFAEVVAEILSEAADDPSVARNAPYTTPVRRLDEAGAAKLPVSGNRSRAADGRCRDDHARRSPAACG